MKKLFRNILILGLLFGASFVLASPLLDLEHPDNGASDVPVDDYFQWEEVGATVKYVLDIDQFTQSEDNILPSVCVDGTCYFAFLDLTVGNIDYLTAYSWRVTAYDADGDPIDSSGEWAFTTEMAPLPPCPYECITEEECGGKGGECVDGGYVPCAPETPCCCQVEVDGNGNGWIPIELKNPLKAETLEEAIEALINFLFYLVMVVAPLMIIYAAFLMLTAAGATEQINKGKTIIFWTLMALVIVLLAKGLPSLIKGAMGG